MPEVTLTPSDDSSYINSSAPDTAIGTTIGTGSDYTLGERNDQTDQKKRPLVQFDFSSIPAGSTINSVTLRFNIAFDRSSNARTARVYRVKRNWVGSEATWNSYSTGNAWQTAGGTGANDIDTTEVATRAFSATETVGAYIEFTGFTTSKIEEMLPGGAFGNNGFLLKMDTESDDGYLFQGADDTNNPELIINYTPPAGGGNPLIFQGGGVSIG